MENDMGTEIERKFLVTGSEWRQADAIRFSQGYLNRDKERTVRVRVAGESATLTVIRKNDFFRDNYVVLRRPSYHIT